MKLTDLKANQVPFYYQLFQGEVELRDEDGYLTGEKEISYSKPDKAYARISPNTNEVTNTPFGIDCVYDKMISTVQDLPIDEFSRLFVDVIPEVDDTGMVTNNYDYEVVAVAKDMHQKMWAIRKIEGK